MNTDDNALGNLGRVGTGGLVMDDCNKLITGFSIFIEITTNMYAELAAVHHGINMTLELGVACVQIETNSLEAVQLIDKATPLPTFIGSLSRT